MGPQKMYLKYFIELMYSRYLIFKIFKFYVGLHFNKLTVNNINKYIIIYWITK